MKSKKRLCIAGAAFIFLTIIGVSFYHNHMYTGIPDLTSTYDSNGNYYLVVVSNTKEIEDREAFAEQVIEMCLDNSFQSVKFCVDEKGYPQSIEASVYQTKEDVGKREAVFQFSYKPYDWKCGYDIYHNPEQYEMEIF